MNNHDHDDDFWMFSFKVWPCSLTFFHDWRKCPYFHSGENIRRRHPRQYRYSSASCADFQRGDICRRGDMCEYSHGGFESGLHPARYRTRFCKYGTSCLRRICFFAHSQKELRHLHMFTGAAVLFPLDLAPAMGLRTTNANGVGHPSMAWPQPNVPALQLRNDLGASRRRSSIAVHPSDQSANIRIMNTANLYEIPSSQNAAIHNQFQHHHQPPVSLGEIFSSQNAAIHNQFQHQQQQHHRRHRHRRR